MGIAPPFAEMNRHEPVAMVRCHLGPGDDPAQTLRYVRLSEFELWRYMMETRHRRVVVVEEVSLWVPENASLLRSSISDPDLCEAVVRIHFEVPGPHGVPVPVERFLSAQTYPEAQAALLAHFASRYRRVTATPGYFVPAAARVEEAS
jgi:hypothetical protein